jgi:hypothetical protein
MRVEVMDYYGLAKPLNRAGYYETEHHSQLLRNILEPSSKAGSSSSTA